MVKGGNRVVVVVVVVTTVVCVVGISANCARVVFGSTRGRVVDVALLIGREALLPLLEGLPAAGRVGGSILSFSQYLPNVSCNVDVCAGKHRVWRGGARLLEVASISCEHK